MEQSNIPFSQEPSSIKSESSSVKLEQPLSTPAGPAPLSKHAQREAERNSRLEEHRKTREEIERKQRLRSWVWRAVGLGMVLLLALLFYRGIINRPPPFTSGEVHWHAQLEMEGCGKRLDLPRTRPGQSHLGGVLLHTHDDNTVHVEGQPLRIEDITLGRFMDAVGVTFSESQLFEYKAGDMCPGAVEPASLHMFVNGQENTDFRAYVIKPTEKAEQQIIRLVLS